MKNSFQTDHDCPLCRPYPYGRFFCPCRASQGTAAEPTPQRTRPNDSNVVVEEPGTRPSPKGQRNTGDYFGGNKQLITVTTKVAIIA